jgi:ABC-type multidrug transport system fused ATPase/permease subunit
MIERFYDPEYGKNKLDRINVKDMYLTHIRRCILDYLNNEPVLFNQSIKENLLYAKPDAADEDIISPLKSSNAWESFSHQAEAINTNMYKIRFPTRP